MVIPPLYWIFLGAVALQRLGEVILSKRNAAWIQKKGGVECGAGHFKWIALLMAFFFLALPLEAYFLQRKLSPHWWIFFSVFLFAQGIRYWAIASLGKFWNVRIWVIPGGTRVVAGPYRWIPHPNYAAVAIELAAIPLMVECYWTAGISLLGFLGFLRIRIPEEERALSLLK